LLSNDRKELEELASQLQIHPLAVEDCLNRNQRAKFEDFENHQLLVWFVFINGETIELEFVVFPTILLLVTQNAPPQGDSWKEFLKISSNHRDVNHMLYQALDHALDISVESVLPIFEAIDE